MAEPNTDAYRVLLLPATRRDGEVIAEVLLRADMQCILCDDARDLAERVEEAVGAVLFTDTVFRDPGMDQFLAVLEHQEPWSDVPTVLLCLTGHQSPTAAKFTRSLHNATVLDRPTPTRILISSLKAALRARARQYKMREQFFALQASEKALNSASEALHYADRRKDEFLAMLAHELRNPLAPIQNATELLSRRFGDSQSQAVIALLKRQTGQLTRLVDDLLDVSRITQGRIELRLAPVQVSAVLAQARESVEPILSDKHQSLSVDTDGADRLYVQGDYARLVQSVANLLTNAAKYTDPGGQLRITARRAEDEDLVKIEVSDNGIGIAADLLPRVFDLFVQGERSLARSQGGLGIGLSVVKRLVQMHGGQIAAQSRGPNAGSTFTITLPLIEAIPQPDTNASQAISGKRILIVDDNQDAANSLGEILRSDGHSLEVAFTGRDAIAQALGQRPDVILLDVGLPDMSGYEVAARLRSNLKETQLIALTGYGQPEDVRRAKDAGFDAHAVKPVDFDALAKLIAEYHPRLTGVTPP